MSYFGIVIMLAGIAIFGLELTQALPDLTSMIPFQPWIGLAIAGGGLALFYLTRRPSN